MQEIERGLNHETLQLDHVSDLYHQGLGIPRRYRHIQAVIVTDSDDTVRAQLAHKLADKLNCFGNGNNIVELGMFPSDTLSKSVETQMNDALSKMNPKAFTIGIYLGGMYDWRKGFYDSFEPWEKQHPQTNTREAYSPGLSLGDLLAFQQMTPNMMWVFEKAVFNRCKTLQLLGRGELFLRTGSTYTLEVPFDMKHAPIVASTGILSDERRHGNIPSGEAHFPPYPFNRANGMVLTQNGYVLVIVNGLCTQILEEGITGIELNQTQTAFIQAINETKRKIAFSELGLGVWSSLTNGPKLNYSLTGEEAPTVLSLEKIGIHCGFGENVGPTEEQDQILAYKPDAFVHTDFVLANPRLSAGNQPLFQERFTIHSKQKRKKYGF